MDGLLGVDAMVWGALFGAAVGAASLCYQLFAQPGGWTELVKSLTIVLYLTTGALIAGWLIAWLLDLRHPWLVAGGGAVWFVVAYVLTFDSLPARLVPWVHGALCVVGYGLVTGLVDGGDGSGSWSAAAARVVGGIVALGTVTGLAVLLLRGRLERVVVTRDLRRLGCPLYVAEIRGHRLGSGSVETAPAPRLNLYYTTRAQDSRVHVSLSRGGALAPSGPARTSLAVRQGETLVVFTDMSRGVTDDDLHAAADSLRPIDAQQLARLVDSWFD